MKFTHICLLCVTVLAQGVEHNHSEDDLAAIAPRAQPHQAALPVQDEHADHGHSEEGHGHRGGHHGDQGEHGEEGGPGQRYMESESATSVQDYRIWLASSGAILVIALCGIFGVLIIPIMQRVFYQHLIQFLISLAVGTLVGDALLHLLPHAVIAKLGIGEDHSSHNSAVWLGLVASAAMVGFFIFEKIVTVLGEWREGRKAQERKVRVVREGHVPSDKAIGEVQCKNKYSTHCINDFDLGMVNETREQKPEPLLKPEEREHDTVIISEHEVAHHGHSHAHSHLHSAPRNISSVAWMVICGDGIHNLADGLAIGAAFADGYMSGISTSVAVLCHELPHEIGDFAMLLKAGMTIKQAIFYNVLSSVLAFAGMVTGLLLAANLPEFTPWMFSATAGIFLYVALVDMMPELSSGHAHPISRTKQHEGHGLALLLQVSGMSIGVGIMLLIALYEHDLKMAMGGSVHAH